MSSLPLQTRFRVHVSSASHVVIVLFGLLFMNFVTSAPIPATTTAASTSVYKSTAGTIAATDSSILLFEDSEFRGIRSRLYVGLSTCVNLIGKLNDFFSSVDTMNNCYLLCEHQNCRGQCKRITGKVTHLSAFGLNDRVSSLRICGEDDNEDIGNSRSSGTIRKKQDTNDSSKTSIRSKPLSPSPVFLRRTFKTSVKLKRKDEEEPTVSPLFSSDFLQRKAKRTEQNLHPSSSDHSKTVMSSSHPFLSIPSIKDLYEAIMSQRRKRDSNGDNTEYKDNFGIIMNRSVIPIVSSTEEGIPFQQKPLRIPRHRRKSNGLVVRK